jgi:hypothetical protein
MHVRSDIMNEYDPKFESILPALLLPDERKEWAAWIEKQLMGTELVRVVEQLIVLGGNHPAVLSLEAWLGEDRNNVLEHGLQKDIAQSRIEDLVRNPALLLELQELVLLEGDNYWLQLPKSSAQQELENSIAQKVSTQLNLPSDISIPLQSLAKQVNHSLDPVNREVRPAIRPSESVVETNKNRTNGWTWAALAATAAAVMWMILNPFSPPSNGQFFAALELQTPAATPQQALQRMALRVDQDWKRGLTDPKALQRQLEVFRDSCDFLIDGPLVKSLDGLPTATQDDIRQRCKKWQEKASELIAALASGNPVNDVQTGADEMIGKLINKLNEIAQT